MEHIPANVTEFMLMVIGSLSLLIFNQMAQQLKTLAVSVKDLAVQIAVVVTKIDEHEKRLNSLERKGE